MFKKAREFNPWPYQLQIIRHILKHPRCGVWAGMGMGKTSSTLTAIDLLFLSGDLTKPVLVLAPLRVARTTWPSEVKKWAHLADMEVQPILGSEKDRIHALKNKTAQVFTINYENIPWLVNHINPTEKDDWPFGMIVSDESTRLKSFRGGMRTSKKGKEYLQAGGGQRARALARVAHEYTDRFVELTGTPSPNGLQDLWGQLWFLDAGRRLGGHFTAFAQRWFQTSFDGYGLVPFPHAQKQIEAAVKDLCISVNPKDYFDIAEPIRRVVHVDLPPAVREKYREMEKEMFMQLQEAGLEHDIEAFNAAAKTQKCLQLASGAVYTVKGGKDWVVVHDEKIEALKSVIEEAAGMPVLVAYQFKSDLARLKKAFPKARELDQSPKTESDWNAGKIPLLFAHPASAGHGLNLQDGGNIIVFFSHDWNLELWQQIRERLGPVRQMQAGHDRPVYEFYIVARGTVDEVVMKRRESKREVQDLLLEAMRGNRDVQM